LGGGTPEHNSSSFLKGGGECITAQQLILHTTVHGVTIAYRLYKAEGKYTTAQQPIISTEEVHKAKHIIVCISGREVTPPQHNSASSFLEGEGRGAETHHNTSAHPTRTLQ
jgi:hypothetical protein